LPAAVAFAEQGIGPGAIERNLASFGESVDFAADLADWQRRMMADAQTSGGLLVSCAAEAVDAVLAAFEGAGFGAATAVGHLGIGPARVVVLG
jgi:selenide,water dikinase